MAHAPIPSSGLSELIDDFDIFFLDQFGVLHDGRAPYPGAVDCLSRLSEAGKKTVLLSNSGKRASENERRLVSLGFEEGSWDVFLSSGEAAWQMFMSDLTFRTGARCYLISRDNDRSAIDGLGLDEARDIGSADVILLAASEGDRYDLAHYRSLLEKAAARKVPCYCTNPDRIMLTPAGPKFGAGRIAELYESLGGAVSYIGKPYPEIYRAALRAVGNPPLARVLCVGDSLEHDIAGAIASGLFSALVRTGILAEMDDRALEKAFAKEKARPDFILPAFVW
jgi:HAD superfamily hydrolase (TIGR01459 family)